MTKLFMFSGNDREFTFSLTENGAPMDLAGAVLRFTAKVNLSDPDIAAVIVRTTGAGITTDADPMTGRVVVTFPAALTAAATRRLDLVWDLQVTRAGQTVTATAGALVVTPHASRTVP